MQTDTLQTSQSIIPARFLFPSRDLWHVPSSRQDGVRLKNSVDSMKAGFGWILKWTGREMKGSGRFATIGEDKVP